MKKLIGLVIILSFSALASETVKTEKVESSTANSAIEKAVVFEFGYTSLENKEEKYPEFAALMQEYRDGILLFDLMDQKVWGKAVQDSVGFWHVLLQWEVEVVFQWVDHWNWVDRNLQ